MAEPATDDCYRCGQPGEVTESVIVHTVGGDAYEYGGQSYCSTPRCADPDGSKRLRPLPPDELRRREEDAWLGWQRAMLAAEA